MRYMTRVTFVAVISLFTRKRCDRVWSCGWRRAGIVYTRKIALL